MKRSTSVAPAASSLAPVAAPKKKKIRLSDRVGANQAPMGDDAMRQQQAAANKASKAVPAAPAAEATGASPSHGTASPGREWTVTIALPGSIVDNAQTQELRSHLVGQVARACAIFNVDEIVVFSPESGPSESTDRRGRSHTDGSIFMTRLLQYLECPQYLRKHIFPVHPDLRCVGLLAPLDAPHHLRIDEPCDYREAVVVAPGSTSRRNDDGGAAASSAAAEEGGGNEGDGEPTTSATVYTGLRKELKMDRQLPLGTRVTVRMPSAGSSNARAASVVPPREPREKAGLYWGFEVRLARGLAAVWSECPHAGGYDLSIGTSEHGETSLHSQGVGKGGGGSNGSTSSLELPSFKHLVVVFGGVEGLEPVVAKEEGLAEVEDDVPALFDHYLNLCPNQGSRTIRTEEALLIGLAALKPLIEGAAAQR